MAFVNLVAEAAESVDHHPDINIRYGKVTLALTTQTASSRNPITRHRTLILALRQERGASMKCRSFRKKHVFHIALSILCLCLALVRPLCAASNPFYPASLGHEVWKSDTSPYKAAALKIDNEMTSNHPDAVTLRYHSLYQAKPKDALALYSWAYAARKAAKLKPIFVGSNLVGPLDSLNKFASPQAYDFVRLHYLIASDVWHSVELNNLGARLLAYKPTDAAVEDAVVENLSVSTTTSDRKQAISIAQQAVRRNPRSANSHALLGDAYQHFWFQTKDRSAASHAIAEYQSYIQLTPPNNPYRGANESAISFIKASM